MNYKSELTTSVVRKKVVTVTTESESSMPYPFEVK